MAEHPTSPVMSVPCEDLLLVKGGQEPLTATAFEAVGLRVATFDEKTWRVVTPEGWRYGYAQDDRKFYFLGAGAHPA